ncbi:hypothetical protein IMAU60066_01679 [Lactobacillus helveticus]|uniref:glycosyltransferase family 32 protein n=1 Tax=Lactobacillus helveticus TaxID=1587 RepID=UPI001A02809B|nr:glycosyltransferase [Lactobacillus helveticus]NRO57247.1 hypothetical protein [Lactobacillus helveticus]
MIPKVINYCWFGGKPLPASVKDYIQTWKEKCPNYIIKEWNENNFDINSNDYVKEAYSHEKWAFVSDYVRLYVLVNYGGIYLDTDVEVLKNLDSILKYDGVCGFEDKNKLSTAILACKPGFFLFKQWLKLYQDKTFILKDGTLNEEPNVIPFTKLCQRYGLNLNGKRQRIKGLEIFPSDVFSPQNYKTGKINITSNTLTIHNFKESWRNESEIKMHKREIRLIKKYGENMGSKLALMVNLPAHIHNAVKKRGLKKEINHIFQKIKS